MLFHVEFLIFSNGNSVCSFLCSLYTHVLLRNKMSFARPVTVKICELRLILPKYFDYRNLSTKQLVMIRAYVYRNIDENDGKLMVVENSIEEFKSVIATQFKLPLESITLFSPNGCEINDIRVIRDNEKVYLNHEKVEDGASCDIDKESLGKLSISETCEIHGKKGVSDWIMLNVGGKHFTTTRSTILAKEPLSMLARMFAEDNNVYLMNPSMTDSFGAYLIDRSPVYFEPILNYLRHGDVILDKHVNPRGVLEEAIFYGKVQNTCCF